jgi:hypothetical protein
MEVMCSPPCAFVSDDIVECFFPICSLKIIAYCDSNLVDFGFLLVTGIATLFAKFFLIMFKIRLLASSAQSVYGGFRACSPEKNLI